MPTDSLDLSVARFEIEQARKQRETELAKQDAAELLARCKELMGETQTTLMERQVMCIDRGLPASHRGRFPVDQHCDEIAGRALLWESQPRSRAE